MSELKVKLTLALIFAVTIGIVHCVRVEVSYKFMILKFLSRFVNKFKSYIQPKLYCKMPLIELILKLEKCANLNEIFKSLKPIPYVE